MKNIIVKCYATPDNLGYDDGIVVLENDQVIFHAPCRAAPNPFRPSDGKPWREAYGWIAPCKTTYRCRWYGKFGKVLLLAEGGELPARYPNSNHEGRLVLDELYVHPGGTGRNPLWPGSGGCTTLQAGIFADLIELFDIGDTGAIAFLDYIQQGAG